MTMVGKKHNSYTKKGMAMAMEDAKKKGQKVKYTKKKKKSK